jgi:hypothetical protein
VTLLGGALSTLLALASCGDESATKSGSRAGAGTAGETQEAGQSGGTRDSGENGAGGTLDSSAGAAGANTESEGGAAGVAGVGGDPGASTANPLFLFTVDATSTGLAGTAVAGSPNPQSVVFSSATPSPDPINGGNAVSIAARDLGLADDDTIDAIAALQPRPSHAVYWFSVAANRDNAEGERPTRLARSSADGEALGDVYFSDATLSFRSLGATSDQLGYNGLVADEQSIGLSPAAPNPGHLDNLTGVQILPSGQLPSQLYFSVTDRAVGLAGSAVALANDAERACTVFESGLDGTNRAAFSCANLGLNAGSDVTGLVVYGTTAPSDVLFTVDLDSTGPRGSGVADAVSPANNIYASTLQGANTLSVAGVALGLADEDELDALTVVDRSPAQYPYSTTCRLTPAPDTAEGAGITVFQSAHRLGHLLLVVGPTGPASPIDSVGAYDLQTCAFIARSTVHESALSGHLWAPVPLAGWSAAAPLSKLEYWVLASDGSSVTRLDLSGATLSSYVLGGVASGTFAGLTLEYEPLHDRFYAVVDPGTGFGEARRLAFARPAAESASGSVLNVTNTPIPHPCAYAPALSGVDAQGNSVFAQLDSVDNLDFRVCTLSGSTGEFTDLPFSWSLQSGIPSYAVLDAGQALYALFPDDAFSVESYALTR